MLIFIPMAGFGDRYLRAGYTQPKPLIPVDGVPMIERVLSCFPQESKFLFAINRRHADETELPEVLRKLRPGAATVLVEPHKDGPVRTVLSCARHLPDDEDILLNYCDFGVDWSFENFVSWLRQGRFDGAMTAYKGFHPHSLGPTLYAYMRNDGERVLEIREKHHFTPNRFEEFASSGLYYFRRGCDLKRLSYELIESGKRVQNEFYVSTVMEHLIEKGAKVGVYPLSHFYQWGTPEDLRDYESWALAMRALDPFLERVAGARSLASQVIPMGGRGTRFTEQGYHDPKPLIDVAGSPMIAQAIACLPIPLSRVLVALEEHALDDRFRHVISMLRPAARIEPLRHVTEGQACTARIGVLGTDGSSPIIDLDAPVLFAPCDTGYLYNVDEWLHMESTQDWDLVVVSAHGHLPAIWRPQMYGWFAAEQGRIKTVSVKKLVPGVPAGEQQVITGTFLFRDGHTFLREVDAMIAENDRINGEFYIDTIARRMVERGMRVKSFPVEKYIPWGTPEELLTFQYWNEVFRGGRPLAAR
ncbi:MAG: NTP transferase domain-containing protein [Candidatus Eisenbacteria bacterium]|nr:NTP transferase domain-containing protein [Candidatus Eisenbacteria bacterium]